MGSRVWSFRKQIHFPVFPSPGVSTEDGPERIMQGGRMPSLAPPTHPWASTGFALAEHPHHEPLNPTGQVAL